MGLRPEVRGTKAKSPERKLSGLFLCLKEKGLGLGFVRHRPLDSLP